MQLMFNFDEPEVIDVVKEEKTEPGRVIDKNPELDSLSMEDLVKIIQKETGLVFEPHKDWKGYYVYRKNKSSKQMIKIHFGNFNYHDLPGLKGDYHREKYIGVDYEYNNGGCGGGVTSIKEAITNINKYKERMEEN